ncbi:NTE family protein [Evansella caseinilytica]|uniref:NTE family protein n=1 Tax=Evansella caseinilytica TaxID=1503961 RepID=A0A1H3KUB5_9BACI|nr:patatin-like phospholipase family protein [Evansella caseinilytica]SDY55807.1 NTE family protein [Evansella caseinilytica]
MLKVDGVFAGGGIKAFSFIGALQVLDQKKIFFERLAGTSAGAIVATFIKAGYTSEEISQLLDDLDLQQLLDPKKRSIIFPFYRWLRLYKKMGFHKGDALEHWLYTALKKKNVVTFADLPTGALKIIASDLSNSQLLVIPDDLPRYGLVPERFSVAKAVRMSCSFPFFFEPVKLTSSSGKSAVIVDGGVLSNFPLWLFLKQPEKKRKRPVLGFRLATSADRLEPRQINNAFSLLHSMVEAMWQAHDQRYISKAQAENIVFIPVRNISATQFSISDEEKQALIQLGAQCTEDFLKSWTY